ncbi:GNAT family N-acetyltransferase [Olivibacter sp. SDN3]|uniref:GNAT family N-acetyltransferase n=1 Tax=Olivibacter sp. SDN3 TaxID=2764720 RepID=UPI0016517098|nr:GNAT family N-acetyltransferase [Olivibacter sp. SDN3]QNL51920.1 GNAT family N-acetyltransferase [Olivibacter sp. SDN3]
MDSDIIIRGYENKDWENVCDIFTKAKPEEFRGVIAGENILPLQKDAEILKLFQNSDIYVAEMYNNVIAFAGYSKYLISFLFVNPEYCRRGVATKLLQHILPMIGNQAWLLVLKTNLAAISLYNRFGFDTAEEFNGSYNDIEVVVLRLALSPQLKPWLLK